MATGRPVAGPADTLVHNWIAKLVSLHLQMLSVTCEQNLVPFFLANFPFFSQIFTQIILLTGKEGSRAAPLPAPGSRDGFMQQHGGCWFSYRAPRSWDPSPAQWHDSSSQLENKHVI